MGARPNIAQDHPTKDRSRRALTVVLAGIAARKPRRVSWLWLLLTAACSSSPPGERDDAAIVPTRLLVSALPGGNGVLELSALDLRERDGHVELYAALQNRGDIPACHAALSVELFDANEQSLAAAIGGLLTQRFYTLRDDPSMIAACIGPGDVSMIALSDFGAQLVLADIAHIVYRTPYFALDVTPSAGLVVEGLTRVAAHGGIVYQGTLNNRLNVALRNPQVDVYPINRSGRPLGLATAYSADTIAPGGSWRFETEALPQDSASVDQRAFPAGALEH